MCIRDRIQTETESESEAQPEKETDIVDAIKIGASRTDVAYALNSDGLEVANLKAGENEIMILQWYDVKDVYKRQVYGSHMPSRTAKSEGFLSEGKKSAMLMPCVI